jgi:hypothetical protein
MADFYYVLPLTSTSLLWDDANNWASSSGGSPGAGIPGANDNVFIDSNSVNAALGGNNEITISSGYEAQCNNLTINTGFGYTVSFLGTYVNSGLIVNGVLTLNGTGGNILLNPIGNPNPETFILLGTIGSITGVTASRVYSGLGKRIYYDGSSTVTNCPFWIQDSDKNTVHITDAAGLIAMALRPDNDYILDNDIDMTGQTWSPVGVCSVQTTYSFIYTNPFTGSFDGGGFTISNLSYDDSIPGLLQAGIFGCVGNPVYSPLIKNLTLSNVSMTAQGNIGGLIGISRNSQIQKININTIAISVTGTQRYVGGLIGLLATLDNGGSTDGNHGGGLIDANISECNVNTITIDNCDDYVGGLTARGDNGTITNCSVLNATMSITSGSGIDVGGFIGFNGGMSISECNVQTATINLTGASAQTQIGGFAGVDEGLTNICYVSGITITAPTGSKVGGFSGILNGTIQNCYVHSGSVSANTNVGGFVGYLNGSSIILNSYSVASVTAVSNSGGLVGTCLALSSIENSYSVGKVSGVVTNNMGGLIGWLKSTAVIINCAWLTSSLASAVGFSDDIGDKVDTLASQSWGTDETDNTNFYSQNHPVYAQGT